MHARVPQNVDLEDRILFGLTAARFGELGVALLAAVTAWRAVPRAGGALALVCLGLGLVLAWVRWRGRNADHWILSAGRYWWRTHEVSIDRSRIGVSLPRAVSLPRRRVSELRVLEGRCDQPFT